MRDADRFKGAIEHELTRAGVCVVTPEFLELAFVPDKTDPILKLALAMGGHRDVSTREDLIRIFCNDVSAEFSKNVSDQNYTFLLKNRTL